MKLCLVTTLVLRSLIYIAGYGDMRNFGLYSARDQRHKTSQTTSHKLRSFENSQEIKDATSIASDSSVYVPPEVGWEIWTGSVIAVVPIVWASIEFYNRIAKQRQCLVCRLLLNKCFLFCLALFYSQWQWFGI